MVRIAMTGGREFLDYDLVCQAMDMVLAKHPQMLLVHGAARGADSLAARWASERRVSVQPYIADWDTLGKDAGKIRNKAMAASGLKGLVAFPGGRGTLHMVKTCEELKVPVWAPYPDYKFPTPSNPKNYVGL